MLFGHNTNVTVGNAHYHVQTEDRGVVHPVIDTSVYLCGRVVHRRKNDYSDLLPLDAAKESILKQRVDEQHAGIEEELRTGALKFDNDASAGVAPELKVELLNSSSWLKGKQASLQVRITDQAGAPASNANVVARMEGVATPVSASGKSGTDGTAGVEFEMPPLAGAEATLVVEASSSCGRGHLRFQLRARPKAPVA